MRFMKRKRSQAGYAAAFLWIVLLVSTGGPAQANDWTSWGLGPLITHRVTAVEFNGVVYVFTQGGSGIRMALMSLICVSPGGCGIPHWVDLGEVPGSFVSAPFIVSMPTATVFRDKLYLLRSVVDTGHVIPIQQIQLAAMDAAGAWSSWQNLPAPNFNLMPGTAPAATSFAQFGGQLYVFATASDGRVHMASCSSCPPGPSIWNSWQEVPGGGLTDLAPVAVQASLGLHLFVHGIEDRGVWLNIMDINGNWTGWREVPGGGRTGGEIAAEVLDNGLLYAAIRGTNGDIQLNEFNFSWSGWRSISVPGFSVPAVAALDNQLFVFAESGGDLKVHRETVGGSGLPTPPPGPVPPPPPPPLGEISLTVDRGCGAGGSSYSLGSLITFTYRVSEAGTGILYDFDPAGTLKTIALGAIPAGVEIRRTATIAASLGVETLVLQVATASGRVLAAACSFSIGGVSPTLAQISTNKGCEVDFAAGESLTTSYSVSVAVTRVRIFNIVPGSGAVLLTPTPLTAAGGTLAAGTVSPVRGDRVLVVVPVTPSAGILSSTCRYRVP